MFGDDVQAAFEGWARQVKDMRDRSDHRRALATELSHSAAQEMVIHGGTATITELSSVTQAPAS